MRIQDKQQRDRETSDNPEWGHKSPQLEQETGTMNHGIGPSSGGTSLSDTFCFHNCITKPDETEALSSDRIKIKMIQSERVLPKIPTNNGQRKTNCGQNNVDSVKDHCSPSTKKDKSAIKNSVYGKDGLKADNGKSKSANSKLRSSNKKNTEIAPTKKPVTPTKPQRSTVKRKVTPGTDEHTTKQEVKPRPDSTKQRVTVKKTTERKRRKSPVSVPHKFKSNQKNGAFKSKQCEPRDTTPPITPYKADAKEYDKTKGSSGRYQYDHGSANKVSNIFIAFFIAEKKERVLRWNIKD